MRAPLLLVVSCLSFSFLVSCKDEKSDSSKPAPSVSSVTKTDTVPPPSASAASSALPADKASALPPPHKKYAHVLHTGDSMVGGGLCRALKPKFEGEGTKFHRDVVESGTIHEFAQNDHLPGLLKKIKPDLVLLTLGSNHIPHPDPEKELAKYVEMVVKRVEGIDCYWIAPPVWKPQYQKFNDWLKTHVAPCKFYDGSNLEISRKPDKIHPDEKGGEVWADDFWKFFKGDGAFPAAPESGLPANPATTLLPTSH